MSARLVPLSALQHYAFCPRQCALIHNDRVWEENYSTAQGQVLHQRADSGITKTVKHIRTERSVEVGAPKLGLVGILDALEMNLKTGMYIPVEYKKGKPKKKPVDEVQLCAQALCLEEMLNIDITHGALWYFETKRRYSIPIDQPLREMTLDILEQVKQLFVQQQLPQAHYGNYCKACSLYELCQPKIVQHDTTASYREQLLQI